ACGPDADADKVRAYCEGSVAHYHWLVDHGVPFRAEFCDEPNREPVTEAGLCFSGGEDSWPFNEVADVVPRGHHPEFPDTAGGFIMERLAAALATTPVQVHTDARAERLIVDAGRVVGLVVRLDGRDVTVRAAGGVVLAAGGFIFNEEMVAEHCPDAGRPFPAWRVGQDNDDGRGIRLGWGAGGASTRMGSFECALPIGPPHRMARNILVDRDGRRFINEDTYTGRIGHQALAGRGGDIFMIVSEETFEVNFVGMRIQWAAETAEELAADIGVPPAGLADTIDAYNTGAERGEDPEWHKEPEFLVPPRPVRRGPACPRPAPRPPASRRTATSPASASATARSSGAWRASPQHAAADERARPVSGSVRRERQRGRAVLERLDDGLEVGCGHLAGPPPDDLPVGVDEHEVRVRREA
ncbi:MAG: FAD-binding protein, partial [Actinomycetota bacterium]